MIVYVIKKYRYYYQSCLNVGLNKHWGFSDDLRSAKFFDTFESAEYMLNNLKTNYKGILDNYKGDFKIKKYEIVERKL